MADAPAKIQRPRGTRDFSPDQMRARRAAENDARRVFSAYGYQEIATPTFENLELFLAKSGPGIIDELYTFEDKSGRKLTLRPELTAPVLRYYYAELAMSPKPLRLYYYGPCYRYDRPQKGRFREFWQFGCELIGPDTPEAGAEIIALGARLLDQLGVTDLEVRIGHLSILKGLLEAAGVPPQGAVMRAADKRDLDAFRKEVQEKSSDPKTWQDRLQALFAATTLDETQEIAQGVPAAETGAAHLESLLTALDDYGLDEGAIRVDPAIARGLDYYTGLVFEMDCPSLGAEKQLLGGGAYDLSGVFGGTPTGSLGFGMGFDRTLLAAGRQALPAPAADLYLLGLAGARPDARRLAQTLRASGLRVDLDVMDRNPAKGLKYANSAGIPLTIVLGEKERDAGRVQIKRMDTGDQAEAPLAQIPDVARALLAARGSR